MKILLAVDGSAYTKRMLAYLAANEELLGGGHEYTVFTAVLPIPPFAAEYLTGEMLAAYHHDEAESVLAPVRVFAQQQGWKAEFRSKAGHAPDLIAAEAESGGYDLLAMGSHGHSALGNIVLGSVVTRVLAKCKTPLLLIR